MWCHLLLAAPVFGLLLSGVSGEVVEEALADTLTQALAAQGVSAPRVKVQRVPAIPRSAAGKAPLIKSYRPSVERV